MRLAVARQTSRYRGLVCEYNIRRDSYDRVLGIYRRATRAQRLSPELKEYLDDEFEALHRLHAETLQAREELIALP